MATDPAVAQTERSFPVLTPEQLARLRPLAKTRAVKRGEILVPIGTHHPPMFVVERGAIEAVRRDFYGTGLLVRVAPGQFSGEAVTLSGQPALFEIRVAEDGVVLELDRDSVRRVIATDPELSELL